MGAPLLQASREAGFESLPALCIAHIQSFSRQLGAGHNILLGPLGTFCLHLGHQLIHSIRLEQVMAQLRQVSEPRFTMFWGYELLSAHEVADVRIGKELASRVSKAGLVIRRKNSMSWGEDNKPKTRHAIGQLVGFVRHEYRFGIDRSVRSL